MGMEVVGDELGRDRSDQSARVGLERDYIHYPPDVGKDRTRRRKLPPTLSSVQRDVPEEIAAPPLMGGELSPREDIQRPVIQKRDWGKGVGKGGVRYLRGAPHLLACTCVKRGELAVCGADVDQSVSSHHMAAAHRGLSAPHPLPSGSIRGDERVIGSN